MDPLTLIVRSVCREVGVESPIEVHRIQTKVQAQLAAQFAGEEFRLYVAKMPTNDRAKRHRSILAECAAGAPAALVARRHGLTVRRVNQMLRAQRISPADAGTPRAIDRGFLAVP